MEFVVGSLDALTKLIQGLVTRFSLGKIANLLTGLVNKPHQVLGLIPQVLR